MDIGLRTSGYLSEKNGERSSISWRTTVYRYVEGPREREREKEQHHLHTRNARMKSDVFARGGPYLTHLFDPSGDACVRIRACHHTRANAREFLRVRRTDVHAGTSRWTHTSGSKPGRADRSGQSASARSLFKVRLTLSTVPEKKSMPGPSPPPFPQPIIFSWVSLPLRLFLTRFDLANRPLCPDLKLR